MIRPLGAGAEARRNVEPRHSWYWQSIREHLAALGLVGKADPRHIEAWMRLDRSTLDGLSFDEFREEVGIAYHCVQAQGVEHSEWLAQSMGLPRDLDERSPEERPLGSRT